MLARPTSLRARRWIALAAVIGAGCGGKVIVDGPISTGSTTGSGSGGSSSSGECVIGVCGDPCTKCTGTSCFTGKCDAANKCQPPTMPVTCTK